MITYAQLASVDAGGWQVAGDAWRRLAAATDEGAQALRRIGRELRTDWTGPAAAAAAGKVDGIGAGSEVALGHQAAAFC